MGGFFKLRISILNILLGDCKRNRVSNDTLDVLWISIITNHLLLGVHMLVSPEDYFSISCNLVSMLGQTLYLKIIFKILEIFLSLVHRHITEATLEGESGGIYSGTDRTFLNRPLPTSISGKWLRLGSCIYHQGGLDQPSHLPTYPLEYCFLLNAFRTKHADCHSCLDSHYRNTRLPSIVLGCFPDINIPEPNHSHQH